MTHTTADVHNLERPWSLYAHGIADGNTYGNAYLKIAHIDTCEEWARVWNHCNVQHIGRTDVKINILGNQITTWSLFQRDIHPEWEHKDNMGGITLSHRSYMTPAIASETWTSLVIECVRGASPNAVLGIQVSQRFGRTAAMMKYDVWLASGARVVDVIQWLYDVTSQPFSIVPRAITTRSRR